MQENNNFETIITTWRRLSGEQIETAAVSMSGDSPDYQLHKKKEEEATLLMPEKSKATATIASAGTAIVAPEDSEDNSNNPNEKQEFIKRDKDETKEAAGDTNRSESRSDDKDYLEDDKLTNKSEKHNLDNEKYGDKVDSVYLRPPPPHKARSNTSTTEEEDCGIKCLYYTLQCCDCVLQ